MTALTVYVFFATWCVPCRQELPHIARLARAFEGHARFVLVSEDAPSTASNVPAFLARFEVAAEVVLDTDSALAARYNPSAALPFVAVVDAAGRVTYTHAGYEPGDERLLEAALGARSAVAASDRSASLTSQSLGFWRRDDFRDLGDPDVTGGSERLDLAARQGRATAAVRLDGTLFSAAGGRDDDARVEKITAQARLGPLALVAGDRHAGFGHGLTLSVRKVDPLGVDTTVRGARVDVEAGAFSATALAGVFNPQNTDPIELRTVADPGDLVAGVELRERVLGAGRLGQSLVVARTPGAAPGGDDVDFALAGAALDVALARARGGLEVVGLVRDGLSATGDAERGHGLYATASFDLGPTTLLVEGKWYRRLFLGRAAPALAYHEPPTLEREDQEVPGNADSAGGRARIEWRATRRTTLYAGALAARFSQDGTDPLDGGLALHVTAGVEQRFAAGASVSVSAGVRDEDDAGGADRLSLVQVNVDAATPLARDFALTGKWDHRGEEKVLFSGPRAFHRGLAVLGLAWTGRATLSLLYGYSTEAAARPVHYPAGELRVELGRRGDVRLFAGRQAGGRVCVSGSCRDVPPFEGARLDVVLRF